MTNFDRVREAMKGQKNSVFETAEGRVLACTEEAGNVTVVLYYDDRRVYSFSPDGIGDDVAWGEDLMEYRDLTEGEVGRLVTLLTSVEPFEFEPPGENKHGLWLPIDPCDVKPIVIGAVYRALVAKFKEFNLEESRNATLYTNDPDQLRLAYQDMGDPCILICYADGQNPKCQVTMTIYPDGAIAGCCYLGTEFPMDHLYGWEFTALADRLENAKYSKEKPSP